MKILSFNVRGLGSRIKRKAIQELIRGQKIDFCCIQETKMEVMNDFISADVWGDRNCSWADKPSDGRAGGILSIWNNEVFSCINHWFFNGALVVVGLWGNERLHCCIINVYAPCVVAEKTELWSNICM
ncbi:hypothetical protein OROGR_025374 [Orobanche gracilis]